MGRAQMSTLIIGVISFLLMIVTQGEAAYSVQEFVPEWLAL